MGEGRHSGDEGLGGDLLAAHQDCRIAGGRLQARTESQLHAALAQQPLGESCQPLGELGQDARLRVQEDDADLRWVEAAVLPRHRAHEVVEFRHHLDARESAAGNHEGQQLAHQLRAIALDGGLLEGADDMTAAQRERVGQVLEGAGVLGETAHPAEIGHRAQGEHQVVERDLVRMGMKPRAGDHHLAREIDAEGLAHVNLGARQQPPHRAHRIDDADRPGNDLRQHGLKDEVVVLGHQDALEVGAMAQVALQTLRRVDAAEATADDHHPRPARGGGRAGA